MKLYVREKIADAMLRELLDVIRAGPAMQQDAVGGELDVEIAKAIAGPGSDVAFEFTTQNGEILQ